MRAAPCEATRRNTPYIMQSMVDVTPPSPPAKLPKWLHVPLPAAVFGASLWFGFYASDHLVTGFELLGYSPWVVGGALVLSVMSASLLAWKSPVGRKGYVVLHHFVIVIVVGACSVYASLPAGRWLWEQSVLRPRKSALFEFSVKPPSQEGGPIKIDGYPFERYERTSQGMMFYAYLAGGPWKSQGVFVPFSESYHGFSRQEKGEPSDAQSVEPTSVRGLFWFVTRR
jgi:hypothetical protein